jgi:hypothetical protein
MSYEIDRAVDKLVEQHRGDFRSYEVAQYKYSPQQVSARIDCLIDHLNDLKSVVSVMSPRSWEQLVGVGIFVNSSIEEVAGLMSDVGAG